MSDINYGIKNYLQDTSYHSTSTKTGSAVFQPGSTDIENLIKSNNIVNRLGANWTRRFCRNGIIDPYNTLTTTKEYIFITKPDLHIFNDSHTALNSELSAYPIFTDAYKRYLPILKSMQYSYYGDNDSPFIAILSNSVKSGLSIPDINAETLDTSQNLYGTKISYRGNSIKSDQDTDFTLEFEDDKYLEVYMWFKLFDAYERLKWLGAVSPVSIYYTFRRILYDQMAAYKLVVGDDGMSLVYWGRIVGCFPTTVPRSAFDDMNNSDTQRISISWKGQFARDMDPIILSDFNRITAAYRKNISTGPLPMYNNEESHVEGSWSSCPYIIASTDSSASTQKSKMMKYALRWAR